MYRKVKVGDYLGPKRVLEVVTLSNGWQIAKTEDTKSQRDFKVKVISPEHPKGLTIKHAHFFIDFYGKFCRDEKKGIEILKAIAEVWNRENIKKVLDRYSVKTKGLPGYSLEFILYALNWILEQEDINFTTRPARKQEEINEIINSQGIRVPEGRLGSQLAISVLCDIANGTHPVEAFYRAGLRI